MPKWSLSGATGAFSTRAATALLDKPAVAPVPPATAPVPLATRDSGPAAGVVCPFCLANQLRVPGHRHRRVPWMGLSVRHWRQQPGKPAVAPARILSRACTRARPIAPAAVFFLAAPAHFSNAAAAMLIFLGDGFPDRRSVRRSYCRRNGRAMPGVHPGKTAQSGCQDQGRRHDAGQRVPGNGPLGSRPHAV